ncbi:hypothetical protein X797_006753 [Metarhizium robertsii]|uniref:Uncharacterized protein n=1 Tax=Metarhizium robertsii TaxID=568076 RepID=A0A0A1UUE0_9HYPO|nr:hypothetical protein X797_006753 [Metarhizium robertsii]
MASAQRRSQSTVTRQLVCGAGCGGSRKRRARAEGAETTFRLSPPEKKKQRKGSTGVL